MSPQELEKEIRDGSSGSSASTRRTRSASGGRRWRTPLVGFADANSPYLQRLPELVMPGHRLPQDYLDRRRW